MVRDTTHGLYVPFLLVYHSREYPLTSSVITCPSMIRIPPSSSSTTLFLEQVHTQEPLRRTYPTVNSPQCPIHPQSFHSLLLPTRPHSSLSPIVCPHHRIQLMNSVFSCTGKVSVLQVHNLTGLWGRGRTLWYLSFPPF